MATKRLARELGLLRQRSSSSGTKKHPVSNQLFSYIIVIDFESTCWREKNNYGQEIIEFPAVLLNTSTGEVESEFHTYVQPQEHPTLSDFCTELTGITQAQVEAGLPLHICLSRFSRWLQTLQQQKGLVFPNRPQHTAQAPAFPKPCTFLTWSDWDLGVCLQYECKRKQINKPSVLNSWIDLRSTYKLFYNRKPKGLNGALQDLGIQFEGREHSGLDDARNTAQLAARMTREGCVLRITRSLDRTPVTSIKASATKKPVEPDDSKKKVSTTKPSTSINIRTPNLNGQTSSLNPNKRTVSLISPKTLLNGNILSEAGRRTATSPSLSTIAVNVATSDAAGGVSVPQFDTVEGPFEELIVEGEERCGSYDDVLLDDVADGFCALESTGFSSDRSIHPRLSCANKSAGSDRNPPEPGLGAYVSLQKKNNSRSCARREPPPPLSSWLLNTTEGNGGIYPERKILAPNTPLLHRPSKQSFSIFTERENSRSAPSVTSLALSDLPVNASLSRASTGAARKGGHRITAPLCPCGRRAKRQQVSSGGPHQGRAFFCCPGRRSGGGAQGVCGFFQWESAWFGKNCTALGSSVSLRESDTSVHGLRQKILRQSF